MDFSLPESYCGYTQGAAGGSKRTDLRAASVSLQVFINRYLDTENQLIPVFNLAEHVLFCMLVCVPRARLSCEHLQKYGLNEFFNAAAVNTLFNSATCKTDCSVSATLDR